MNKKELKLIDKKLGNSIKPSIEETERFIIFLNKKFNLKLPDNLIVNIKDMNKNTKGYFMPETHDKHFENTVQSLNNISISSIHLKDNPYETIAHEVAHFYNFVNNIKDVSSNQYHNKKFKVVAEKLLLKVERGNRGFAYTSETDEFKKMLKEFKTNDKAFAIYQKIKENKAKSPNRNILYMCECGVKVRTAFKPFMATCQHCNTDFERVK